MNAKLHQLSVDKAAEVVGVSTATMRNWVKAGHITPVKQRPLSFSNKDINKLKNSLKNGSLQKLTTRANKVHSTSNILPFECASNAIFFDNVETIKAFVDEKKLNLNSVLFVATIKVLAKKNEVTFHNIENVFSENICKS